VVVVGGSSSMALGLGVGLVGIMRMSGISSACGRGALEMEGWMGMESCLANFFGVGYCSLRVLGFFPLEKASAFFGWADASCV